MPLIERSLEPEELDKLFELIDEYKADLNQKVPRYLYALTVGLLLCTIISFIYFDKTLASAVGFITSIFLAVGTYQVYLNLKEKSDFAEQSLNEIQSIFKEEKLQLDSYQFTKGLLLQVNDDFFYLLETKAKNILVRKHCIEYSYEFYPYSKIEYYKSLQIITKHLGESYEADGETPIIKKLFSDNSMLIDILELENGKIIPTDLKAFLKDYEKALELVKIKEQEEYKSSEKMSTDAIRNTVLKAAEKLMNVGKEKNES